MSVTNEGLNYTLNAIFPTTPNGWYIGLISQSPVPVLAPSDTLTSHAGWVEIAGGGVGYTGNRPLWTNGVASSQVVTNATYVSFAITATANVNGILLASVASGSSGTLFGTSPFVGGPQSILNTDTLQITLTVSNSGA